MAINNFNVGVGTTSQLTRYRYVATGGETSVSGTDADGKTLSYTVGLEQVFLNGVNLVRGQDYTATNGTSVGSLTALVASDVVEVFAFVPFNIANALTVSTVDAKGDLLVGTGADAVGRLAVGTDGQLLSAASGETSGLKWANGGLTLIKTETFSASAAVNVNDVFSSTYTNYKILLRLSAASTTTNVFFRLRVAGADSTAGNYYYAANYFNSAGTNTPVNAGGVTQWNLFQTATTAASHIDISICAPFATNKTSASGTTSATNATQVFGGGWMGLFDLTTSFTGFSIIGESGNLTGTIQVFGVNQ